MHTWENKKGSFLFFIGIAYVITLLLYTVSNKGSYQQYIKEFIISNGIINRVNHSNEVILNNSIIRLDNHSFNENDSFYYDKITHTEELSLSKYNTDETKWILVWNPPFGALPGPFNGGGEDWFRQYSCPIWRCEVVPYTGTFFRNSTAVNWKNSSIPIENFDAVVFHDPTWHDFSNIPMRRSPHQHYIWWSEEAPGLHSFPKLWDVAAGFFNWTMSYRWDSDIPIPYGFTRRLNDSEIQRSQLEKKKNYAEGKIKMVAWFVGNCAAKSGRFEYIKRLQQHIPVDVYGSCGNLTCTVNNETACRIMMAKNYKFYIAFENSLCLDYVTEKLFYNAQFDVIPVVLDLHGQYARFVPAKSYINALDFPSVKDLANYLKVLDKNDTLYNEYFLWKEHYFMEYSFHGRPALRNRIDPTAHGICGLCSKLHNPSEPVSVYRNLTKWWLNDAACSALKFPSESVENDTWIAVDYHPPYNVRAPYRWA